MVAPPGAPRNASMAKHEGRARSGVRKARPTGIIEAGATHRAPARQRTPRLLSTLARPGSGRGASPWPSGRTPDRSRARRRRTPRALGRPVPAFRSHRSGPNGLKQARGMASEGPLAPVCPERTPPRRERYPMEGPLPHGRRTGANAAGALRGAVGRSPLETPLEAGYDPFPAPKGASASEGAPRERVTHVKVLGARDRMEGL